MRTTIRLTAKLLRFELLAVAAGTIALAAVALFVAARLDAFHVPVSCFTSYLASGPVVAGAGPSSDCERMVRPFFEFNESGAGRVMAAMAVVPLLAGLLLGVPLVSREIEGRTTAIAWSLTGSRRRWLLERAVIVGLALICMVAIPAFAADRLETARQPWVVANASFADIGLRGLLVVARAALAFGIGVLAGLLVGRQLPALILAGVVLAGILTPVDAVRFALLQGDAAPTAATDPASADPGAIQLDQRLRDPAGHLLTVDDAAARAPKGVDAIQWAYEHYEAVTLVVPGKRYPASVLRESALLGGTAILLVGLSLSAVERRRPA